MLVLQQNNVEGDLFQMIHGVEHQADKARGNHLRVLAIMVIVAAVLPGYLTPKPDGRYTVKFLPPVDLSRTGDTNRDIAVNTHRLNGILEGIIREQPGTWLWGHKRWKNQPEGRPDLYRLSEQELRAFLATKMAARRDSRRT